MLKVARGVARYTPNGVVLVSVDPGKHVCGVAVWQDVVLLRAFLVKAPFGDSYGEMKYAPQRWVSLAGDVRDTVEEVCAAVADAAMARRPLAGRWVLGAAAVVSHGWPPGRVGVGGGPRYVGPSCSRSACRGPQ